MAFSSIPTHLDPSNWHQQQNHHHQIIGSSGGGGGANPLLPAASQHSSGPHPLPHGGGTGGSIRPGSMAERARIANIPLPEQALKCPRCESTNTKFCYFNNYNLSQPRHFCKSCRRYWTRGGALRSVPIGGGCRRNKRSKSSPSSKSQVTAARQTTATNSTDNNNNNNNPTTATTLLGFPPLRFMSPLGHQFTENLASADHHLGFNSFSGVTATTSNMNYHGGGGSHFLRDGQIMSSGSVGNINEPWRLQQFQQFPFMGGLDQSSSPGIFQFHGSHPHHQAAGRPNFASGSLKMEMLPRELNLSRQLVGGGLRPQASTDQQWNNNNNSDADNWNEFSGFSSSSTSKPL